MVKLADRSGMGGRNYFFLSHMHDADRGHYLGVCLKWAGRICEK